MLPPELSTLSRILLDTA